MFFCSDPKNISPAQKHQLIKKNKKEKNGKTKKEKVQKNCKNKKKTTKYKLTAIA